MDTDQSSNSAEITEPVSEIGETPASPVSSAELLKGAQEILIDHEGEIYRLRVTRNGKLILQK